MIARIAALFAAPFAAGLASGAALGVCAGLLVCAGGPAAPLSAAERPADASGLPDASDYAYGFPIDSAAGSPDATLYRVELPIAFYRSTSDPELRDSGVYNDAGHPVPRVFEPAPAAERAPAVRRAVPFFALSRAESQASAGRLRLILERQDTRLQVDAPDDPAASPHPARRDLDSYIVQLGAENGAGADEAGDEERAAPVVALHLGWRPRDQNFLGRVEVEASDDLAAWQPLGGGTLADLRRDGGRIERRSVEISPTRARYLRLRWKGLPGDWSLTAVEAEEASGPAARRRHWVELPHQAARPPEATGSADRADEGWIFDLHGSPPVDRLALELPYDNTVVRARISAWDSGRKRWVAVHRGLFYHLREEGNALSSEPAAFRPQRTGRFKVEIESGHVEGGWGVRIGWRPDTLVFVAQGRGPYRLVAGRALAEREGFPQARTLGDRGILDLVDDGRYGRATLGERFELGGPRSLEARQPVRWRIWGLWAVLIAGVLFVGGMAWRLLRETSDAD